MWITTDLGLPAGTYLTGLVRLRDGRAQVTVYATATAAVLFASFGVVLLLVAIVSVVKQPDWGSITLALLAGAIVVAGYHRVRRVATAIATDALQVLETATGSR